MRQGYVRTSTNGDPVLLRIATLSEIIWTRRLYRNHGVPYPTMSWPITVTPWWARWRLKSPASRLFIIQLLVQAQIKVNIKAPRHWPLWGEFTGDRWIPRRKASNAEHVSIWWRHYANLCNGCDVMHVLCVIIPTMPLSLSLYIELPPPCLT